MWVFFSLLLIAAIITISVLRSHHNKKIKTQIAEQNLGEEEAKLYRDSNTFPLTVTVQKGLAGIAAVTIVVALWSSVLFYAQPGYHYHVRTIAGTETHVTEIGWNFFWFGKVTPWKNAMSLQTSNLKETLSKDTDTESSAISAELGPQTVTFLDQVDGQLYATVRFKTPLDDETFFKMVHEYRTPENLMRTALIPAFKETATVSAQLMTAEEFFSGGRSVFASEFENQMFNGVYLVQRVEKEVGTKRGTASAKAQKGRKQMSPIDDETKTITVVEKKIDPVTGKPMRNNQKFTEYGISVVEARLMDMVPNAAFRERMKQKQEASAARAVAKEQRLQEEEKKLLAEAAGARAVAERQAEEKQKQIVITTRAETEKQKAITDAERILEQARIEKLAAQEVYERDQIKAKSIRVLADAEAHAKKVVIQANGALEQKIEAWKYGVDRMATAIEKRQVPNSLFLMGGAEGSDLAGSSSEINKLMQIIAADSAKNLSLRLDMKGDTSGKN